MYCRTWVLDKGRLERDVRGNWAGATAEEVLEVEMAERLAFAGREEGEGGGENPAAMRALAARPAFVRPSTLVVEFVFGGVGGTAAFPFPLLLLVPVLPRFDPDPSRFTNLDRSGFCHAHSNCSAWSFVGKL